MELISEVKRLWYIKIDDNFKVLVSDFLLLIEEMECMGFGCGMQIHDSNYCDWLVKNKVIEKSGFGGYVLHPEYETFVNKVRELVRETCK